MTRAARNATLCLLAVLVIWSAGCDSVFDGREERYPAPLLASSAPESLVANDPVPVRVYSSGGDCTVRTFPSEFVAVDDTTFELSVTQSGGTPGVGCPPGVYATDFTLAHAPAGRFHLRLVGADTLDLVVHGGAQPAALVRHTFRIIQTHMVPDSLIITLVGCHSEGQGRLVCADTLGAIPIGLAPATFTGPCTLGGVPYEATIAGFPGIRTSGTLFCRQPWQTVIRR